MLFYVVRLSYYFDFEVEHVFLDHQFPLPSFKNYHALSGAYFRCAEIKYFIPALVAVSQRFNAASKKEDDTFS